MSIEILSAISRIRDAVNIDEVTPDSDRVALIREIVGDLERTVAEVP